MTTQKWYKYSDKTTDQTDGSNTGRHNFIRTGALDLVFWNLRLTEMLSLNKK